MKINRLEPGQNIFFTSDTHYGHANIVRGTSKWTDKNMCRVFDTVEEMNNAIVKNINSMVKENDILFHLGDWSFGGKENIREFRDRLICKNIHLILGNHDIHIHKNSDGLRDIFATVKEYREIEIFGQHKIVLSHYPMRTWNNAYKGSIMLFGHTHGNISDYIVNGIQMKTMDIGLDTNNLMPYRLKDILSIMENRNPLIGIDHHSSDTTNHS